MLKPDVKRTEPLDLIRPVLAFAKKHYTSDNEEQLVAFVTKVQEYRKKIQVIQTSDTHMETAKENLTHYVSLLNLLESRFPMAAIQVSGSKTGSEKTVNVPIVWYDMYRPKQKCLQPNGTVEKACCIYNIAALQGAHAVSQNRDTVEGAQAATVAFCKAARSFEIVRDQLVGSIKAHVTTDMSPDSLTMWATLMLAQANTCVYEKGVKTKMTRTLLAKLAMRVATDYGAVLGIARRLAGAIGDSYMKIFQSQEATFMAAATFQQAMAERDTCEKEPTTTSYSKKYT